MKQKLSAFDENGKWGLCFSFAPLFGHPKHLLKSLLFPGHCVQTLLFSSSPHTSRGTALYSSLLYLGTILSSYLVTVVTRMATAYCFLQCWRWFAYLNQVHVPQCEAVFKLSSCKSYAPQKRVLNIKSWLSLVDSWFGYIDRLTAFISKWQAEKSVLFQIVESAGNIPNSEYLEAGIV